MGSLKVVKIRHEITVLPSCGWRFQHSNSWSAHYTHIFSPHPNFSTRFTLYVTAAAADDAKLSFWQQELSELKDFSGTWGNNHVLLSPSVSMSSSYTKKQTKREENHLMEDKKKKKQEEKKKKDAPKKVSSKKIIVCVFFSNFPSTFLVSCVSWAAHCFR